MSFEEKEVGAEGLSYEKKEANANCNQWRCSMNATISSVLLELENICTVKDEERTAPEAFATPDFPLQEFW